MNPLPSPDSPTKSITAPLLLWLLIQLIALTLAAARVPLCANFVTPGESLATDEMLVVQFASSAMLFPLLLRDARSCAALILSAAPMLQLAAALSMTPLPRVVASWTCLALWLTGLAL